MSKKDALHWNESELWLRGSKKHELKQFMFARVEVALRLQWQAPANTGHHRPQRTVSTPLQTHISSPRRC